MRTLSHSEQPKRKGNLANPSFRAAFYAVEYDEAKVGGRGSEKGELLFVDP
jgi:hypothetical protein